MSDRVSTQIKCSDCGKMTTVNFKPNANRPVYCRECLPKHRSPRPPQSGGYQSQPNRASNEGGGQAWSRRRENWK
jgi:CxxC-x17-CxxC domain-containing protein